MCHSSARERSATEARKLIADGIDPNSRRKAQREASADTFEAAAVEWLALQIKALSADTMAMLRARRQSYLDAAPHRGTREAGLGPRRSL